MKTETKTKDLVIEPFGLRFRADNGSTVAALTAARGGPIRSDCGGKGFCGQCRILVSPAESFSEPTGSEKKTLSDSEINEGWRLACQTRAEGGGLVRVPPRSMESGEALSKDVKQTFSPGKPVIQRLILPTRPLKNEDGDPFADLTSVYDHEARKTAGHGLGFDTMEAVRAMARPELKNSEATLIIQNNHEVRTVLAGRHPRSLGVAIDLGTTTIAAHLCDLTSGRILSSAAGSNAQRFFGEDVISRITHAAHHPEGLDALREAAVGIINSLIEQCLSTAGAEVDSIDDIVLVGNTTMEQIIAGIHPYNLGVAPYIPVTRFFADMPAHEIGLRVKPWCHIHLIPAVSGFIGGDTVGAVLAAEPHMGEDMCLVADLGTNGELVLGNRHGLWAASCATGPAFEGAHISCGMRAAKGAICKFDFDPETRQPVYDVIGGPNIDATGVCGSGLIDLVAALRRFGYLDKTGRLSPEYAVAEGDNPAAAFAISASTQDTRTLHITQKDIRQLQLAKAALSVGIDFLMRAASVEKIDRLILTGAFGASFNWQSAMEIGALPSADAVGRVDLVDNAAGAGAVLALLDQGRRQEARDLVKQINVVELAANREFQSAFITALEFPPVAGESRG